MKLRVLTYNIHGARGTDGVCDFKRIGLFLKSQNIDVALLQEFETRSQYRDTEQDIHDVKCNNFTFFEGAPTIRSLYGWYGNAIFSKFPIEKSSIIDISTPGREPRNIMDSFVRTPNGVVRLVNTHKGLKVSERSLQYTILHRLVDVECNLPLLVGGDFNEWALMTGPLRKINDVLRPISPGPTFPTFYPFLRLDRMWCRPFNLVVKSEVLKTKETRIYSDHFPVLVEIEI